MEHLLSKCLQGLDKKVRMKMVHIVSYYPMLYYTPLMYMCGLYTMSCSSYKFVTCTMTVSWFFVQDGSMLQPTKVEEGKEEVEEEEEGDKTEHKKSKKKKHHHKKHRSGEEGEESSSHRKKHRKSRHKDEPGELIF